VEEVINAKIVSTKLGKEDHGIFTAWLFLEWPNSGIGFGGFAFDEWDEELQKRVDKNGFVEGYISEILDTVGVDNWEDLKGKYVRAKIGGVGSKCQAIGNLLENKWFNHEEFFGIKK
jgi:hypothetical protein